MISYPNTNNNSIIKKSIYFSEILKFSEEPYIDVNDKNWDMGEEILYQKK